MPVRLPRITKPSRRTVVRRLIPAAIALALVAGVIAWAVAPEPRRHTATEAMITVLTGPDGDEPVALDTTLYLPNSAGAQHSVPAILLAHGFGGTKRSVADDAADFADRGYAVLTYSAEGMGRSGGLIHLNSPDYEIKDAQRLLDWLADQPEILLDAPGDPRVAVVGGSYGGALALMLAGVDHRVDAIVPMITWHDLADAFLPEASGSGAANGVFKRQWAGLFFGRAAATGLDGDLADLDPTRALPDLSTVDGDPSCGRFAPDVCAAYLEVATTGAASPASIALLRRSSPAPTLANITAPTLLIQGQADSLFPLSDALANYRAIAATGTPVRMDWFAGGHDGGDGPRRDQDRVRFLTIRWLDHNLKGTGTDPGTDFTYSRVTGFDTETRRVSTTGFRATTVPDTPGGLPPAIVPVSGPAQPIFNPPGGNPGAISTLPGSGASVLATALGRSALEIPGQHADFLSEPLPANTDVVGTPTVRIRAASPTGEAVLFVKLYDLDPDGGASLPFGLAAPVRLRGLPASIDESTPVTVSLPPIVYRFEQGHRVLVTVATSDQAYATPDTPTVYTVALEGATGAVTLPTLAGEPIPDPDVIWRYLLAAVVAVITVGLLAALVVARLLRRRRTVEVATEDLPAPGAPQRARIHVADVPLVVRGLRKEYGDGFVAVQDADFTVHRGQVVGLLGPNGAGKTTSLRVLMGMTRPTKGEILVFGHHLTPGAEVLRRVGALVEGPGFLPHLSGLQNLTLFWRSTGRPFHEARLDEALAIAGLGTAIHRKVRTYSHGMKQRLAIAQAMLGRPELLVLDEPTDGLDPPQIAEMRRVLRDYATDGRAVLVSSHLLAEVEQTCTHVVVMHKGVVVADGPVEDVVGDSPVARIDVSDVTAAQGVLRGLPGIREVAPDGATGLLVDLDGTPRAEAVAALVRAGVGVDRVVPRRRLEDAFLALVGGDAGGGGER